MSTLELRLWLIDLLQGIDGQLHLWSVPGRWWCDALDRSIWWLMKPYADRPAGLP